MTQETGLTDLGVSPKAIYANWNEARLYEAAVQAGASVAKGAVVSKVTGASR